MSERKHYQPIGTTYRVEFMDAEGFHWTQVVVIPYGKDATYALEIIQKAYPGRKIKNLCLVDHVYHGHIDKQRYEQ